MSIHFPYVYTYSVFRGKGFWETIKSFNPIKEKEKPKVPEIGSPQNTVHSGHVGVGKGGIEMTGTNIPPDVKEFINGVNLKMKEQGLQLTEKETMYLIKYYMRNEKNINRLTQAPTTNNVTSTPSTNVSTTYSSNVTTSPHTTQQKSLPKVPERSHYRRATLFNTSPTVTQDTQVTHTGQDDLSQIASLLTDKDRRIDELERQIAVLENRIQSLSRREADYQKLVSEKETLLRENRELDKTLSMVRADMIKVESKRKTMLLDDIHVNFEAKLIEMQTKLNQQIELEKSRSQKLETELKKVLKESEEYKSAKTLLSNEMSRVQEENQVLEKRAQELEGSLKKIAAEYEKEKELVASKIQLIDSESSSLKVKNDKIAHLESSKKELEESIHKLKLDHSKEIETLSAFQREFQNKTQLLEAENRSLKLDLESERATKSQVSGEVDTFKQSLKKELDTLREDLKKTKVENATLSSNVASLARENDMKENELKTTKSTLSDLKHEMEQLNVSYTELELSQKLMHENNMKHITEIQGKHQSSEGQLMKEIESLKDEVRKYRGDESKTRVILNELETLKSNYKASQDNVSSLEAKNSELNATLNDLQVVLEGKKLLESETKKRDKFVEDEIENLRNTLETISKSYREQYDQNTTLQNELQDLKAKHQEYEIEVELLRSQLDRVNLEKNQKRISMVVTNVPPPMAPPPPSAPLHLTTNTAPPRQESSQSLLDSIRNPNITLKQVTVESSKKKETNDIFSKIADKILRRRENMQEGDSDSEEEDVW